MKFEERETQELIVLVKRFIELAEIQYREQLISKQELEHLIGKKIDFIRSVERELVC